MPKEERPGFKSKFWLGSLLFVGSLGLAGVVGWFFPITNEWLLIALEKLRFAPAASWLRTQSWASQLVVLLVAAVWLIFFAVKLRLKIVGKAAWFWLLGKFHTTISSPRLPDDCSTLAELQRSLFPDETTKGDAPELVGRGDELAWLAQQCKRIASKHKPVAAFLLWGPQGIGKTHLAHAFGTSLKAGRVTGCKRWQVWWLRNREFEPGDVAQQTSSHATLLIWDDISLDDSDTRKRFDALRAQAAQRAKPLVILLTGWQSRDGTGLTSADRAVDDQLEVPPLLLDAAQSIYPNAARLDDAKRGHPLMLRLLAVSKDKQSGSTDLWQSCTAWAADFKRTRLKKYQVSEQAASALAVVSSSDAMPWKTIQSVFNVATADLGALRQLGRIVDRKGEPWLVPMRPDLLGWAFAHTQLEVADASDLGQWAIAAWNADFFDTGRFFEHAVALGRTQHVWVKALQAPVLSVENRGAALARAKAATNAGGRYGDSQRFEDMQREIAVSEAIAQRFPEDREIQLERAKAATNAVAHYGGSQRFEDMQREIAVSEAIAQRFPEDREIQLVRAQAATNAIAHYGGSHRFEDMQREIAVSEAIAQRFPDDREIHLRLARCLLMGARSIAQVDAVRAQRFADQLGAHLAAHPTLLNERPFNQSGQAKGR